MSANLHVSAAVAERAAIYPARIGDEILIRPLRDSHLDLICPDLNPDRNKATHRTRLSLQDAGTAAYLIAWHEHVPVAHGLLLWNGPLGNPKQYLPMPCPYIEDLWVRPDHRSQGVGGAMVTHMEELAAERGYEYIGLSVGIDNVHALRLYHRLGYVRQSVPLYTLSGVLQNADGEIMFWSEECHYFRKQIAAASGARSYE